MAKNKGKDKSKELKADIEYNIKMFRKERLTLEEYEFYCNELDFQLSKYTGKDKAKLELYYKLWTEWLLKLEPF